MSLFGFSNKKEEMPKTKRELKEAQKKLDAKRRREKEEEEWLYIEEEEEDY